MSSMALMVCPFFPSGCCNRPCGGLQGGKNPCGSAGAASDAGSSGSRIRVVKLFPGDKSSLEQVMPPKESEEEKSYLKLEIELNSHIIELCRNIQKAVLEYFFGNRI